MIRSMTGFGDVQREAPVGLLLVQVRTVNHRHFHCHFRLPIGAERWEADLTQILRERMSRGHVHYRMAIQPGPESERPVLLDDGRVKAYLDALERLKQSHKLAGEVDLALITRFGDIFQLPPDELERLPFDEVAAATRDAVEGVVELREREGAALARDLLDSLATIEESLEQVEALAPGRLVRERDRLRAAVAELSGDAQPDEERLAREVAYLADRWDINEEIVRLRSHVVQFKQLVEGGDGTEPAGKRLGFWVQEMHREGNTIGSKGNDPEIARHTIEIKTAIEKLREQVENVE